MVFASEGEREAIAMEIVVKVNQQTDMSSRLVYIAWGLLNINSNNEYSLPKIEHLPHIVYH